jgi:hypothetical protein
LIAMHVRGVLGSSMSWAVRERRCHVDDPVRECQPICLPIRPNRHELVRNVDAEARGGRKMVEDAQGIHELLADPALFWERIDARVFDGEVAGDGFDDGLTRMVILGPRVDLQAWMSDVPEVLDKPSDDLPIGRNPLLLRHAGRF